MTKDELINANSQLLDLVRDLSKVESMTATDMFFWGIAISIIGALFVWLGGAIKKSFSMEIGKLVMIQEMHIEELVEMKERQIKSGDEIVQILLRLENHEGRIETQEKLNGN